MNKRMILNTSVVVASFLSFVSASFAWFIVEHDVDMSGGKGYTASSYFYSGDGSSDDPYVINDPIHMYNLAWLQYLGEFNKPDENGDIKQYHFVLGADVDMSGLVLPPIGTTEQPFIGTFDGQGYTVSNLVVSNVIGRGENQITRKPLKVEEDEFTNINIVGMFGVVGDYSGNGTYASFTPSISNTYIDGAIIAPRAGQTLAGVLAGYVNGETSQVGVNNSTLKIASGSTSISSITTNISDYTLVGYCEPEYRNTLHVSDGTVYTPQVKTYSDVYSGNDGSESAWGGSINMMSMYNRLKSIRSNQATRTTGYVYARSEYTPNTGAMTTTNATNNYVWTYTQGKTGYNEKIGSFVMPNYQSSNTVQSNQYTYLSGGTHVDQIKQSTARVNAFRISRTISKTVNNQNVQTTFYLNATADGIASTTSTTNLAYWAFDSNNHLYTVINNRFYYLNVGVENNAALSLSVMPLSVWTRNTNNNRFSTAANGNTYYLVVTSNNNNTTGTWAVSANTTDASLSVTASTRSLGAEKTNHYVDYTGTNNTYFPLRTKSDSNYEVHESNTGYVIAGSNDIPDRNIFPLRAGDIRVSQYAISSNNTYNISTTSYSNKKIGSVYTIDGSGSHTIPANTSFVKYADSKDAFQKVLSSDNNVYGLHFMNSQISMNNIVTASYACVNKEEYRNYQFPADSIDFHLKEKGIVNFFAGTYFSGNDSFFSLHNITRNADNTIASIKEIEEIYSDGVEKHSYVYRYSDGTYSRGYTITSDMGIGEYLNNTNALPSGYASIFKTAWIKKQSSALGTSNANKYLYYFEVPVNMGEYALGSVSGGTGAYLLYLDIAANAQKISYTVVNEEIKTTSKTYVYPYGVALVSPSGDVDDQNSIIAIAIAPTFSGDIGLSIVGTNAVANMSSTNGVTIGYINEETVLRDKNSNELEDDVQEEVEIIRRTHIVAVNTTTMAETTIVNTQGTGVVITRTDENGDDITSSITSDETTYFTNVATKEGFVTLSSGSVLLNYRYSYFNPTTVGVSYELLFLDDPDSPEGEYYKLLEGYSIVQTVESGDGPINIKVVLAGDTYKVYINDEEQASAVVTGDEVVVQKA